MDRGYSHQDDAKEFAGGFALVRKDYYSAKKPIKMESEWSRVFKSWRAGVELLYPHCIQELQGYQEMVVDLFRAASTDPTVAIQFDIEARDRYARTPYHMDDRSRLHLPLLSQMFQKCNMDIQESSSNKRPLVPCQNWSLGICLDPCPNNRKHGICSECGGRHKARDQPACFTSLEARRGKAPSTSNSESRSSGSGRA